MEVDGLGWRGGSVVVAVGEVLEQL